MARLGATLVLFLLVLPLIAAGCNGSGLTARLYATSLEAPPASIRPAGAQNLSLAGAGGEWLDFIAIHEGSAASVRVAPLQRATDSALGRPPRLEARIYRVADLPADTNHAGYLRLYGGTGGVTMLPRALVPLAGDGRTFRLSGAGPSRLWVDLRLPRGLERGRWRTALEALSPEGEVLARLPIEILAHGFDLPEQRSLIVSGTLDWERLAALWPDAFGSLSPTLLSRTDIGTERAVLLLDAMMAEAQSNRLQLGVPALSGVIKWPAGRPPEAWWQDYDRLVDPWLTGEAFPDGVGFQDWPVPRMPGMGRYSESARLEYWRLALAHLEDAGHIDRSLVVVEASDVAADPASISRGLALTPTERLRLSEEAGSIARAYPNGRIALPLESDQIRFTGPENPQLFPPGDAHRLMIRGEGLVTDHAVRPWPAGLPQPQRRLELDGPTPAPVPGPGANAADVRLQGWLAYLRMATHLDVGHALPAAEEPSAPADPTRLTLFYPGELFGAEGPVPSVQLKWLRRAQQDYEYLAAAGRLREETYARVIARALVRPVRVASGNVESVMPLIAGTPDAEAWREGLALVADKIAIADPLIRAQLGPRFVLDHTNSTTTWLAPRERPVPIITGTQWDIADDAGRPTVILRLSGGVYNPSDARPEGMRLAFAEMPGGESPDGAIWRNPGALELPEVPTYEVGRFTVATSAWVEALEHVFPTFQQAPLRLSVQNLFSGASANVSAVAPAVVVHGRRETPVVDGLLGEWMGNEAIIDGRMVLMHDRAAVQSGEVMRTERAAQAFVGWTEEGLHVAFRLEGAGVAPGAIRQTRNFVETEYGRAWGEDVCEILVQPVWTQLGDPVDGPLLHIVAKPNGAFARRRVDRRTTAEPWQTFESGMRFAATVDEAGVWRGEVTIPWAALREASLPADMTAGLPALLRFNLSHHDGETGRSASWAGPVDYGTDEGFTGALILRPGEAD